MKFIVENEPFAKALARVKSCIPNRSTIPILAHVVVEARAADIVMRASNLDRETEVTLAAEVSEPGAVALPGEVLVALSRKLTKGGQTEVATDGDRVKIASGSSKYDLRTLPAADFPSAKEMGTQPVVFSMPAETLRTLIQSVAYACDATDTRAMCQGVHLCVAGREMVAVGSDGLRLALRAVDMPKGSATMPAICIPVATAANIVEVIADSKEDVELAVSRALIDVRMAGLRLASQLVNGDLIPYDKFIPKAPGYIGSFRAYVLREAIERACVVFLSEKDTNRRIPVLEFAIGDGAINLKAGIKGAEQGTETIEADTKADKTIRLNATYLTEMLALWPETATAELQQESANAPVRFTSPELPGVVHVVMPNVR